MYLKTNSGKTFVSDKEFTRWIESNFTSLGGKAFDLSNVISPEIPLMVDLRKSCTSSNYNDENDIDHLRQIFIKISDLLLYDYKYKLSKEKFFDLIFNLVLPKEIQNYYPNFEALTKTSGIAEWLKSLNMPEEDVKVPGKFIGCYRDDHDRIRPITSRVSWRKEYEPLSLVWAILLLFGKEWAQ